jgi:hypothetical protein
MSVLAVEHEDSARERQVLDLGVSNARLRIIAIK